MTARIVFRISIVALLVYLAVTQKCPASGRSESSIIGWMLREHVYDTLLAELPFTCVFKCREDNRCQSFNWVISLLTCEFNNRTKEARPEDFIPNPDRSYYPRDLKRGKPAYQGGAGGGTPYNGLYGGGPTERVAFVRLQVYQKSSMISLFKVNERVGDSFRPVKGPKRANRRILWLKKVERFLFFWGRVGYSTKFCTERHSKKQ